MAKSGTSFQPGQSGNPKGRPKKERALTAMLERAGSKSVTVEGKKVSGKQFLARQIWQLLTMGHIELDSKRIDATIEDWIGAVKWLYNHVDGPPKQELDVNAVLEFVKGYAKVTPDDWDGSTDTDS